MRFAAAAVVLALVALAGCRAPCPVCPTVPVVVDAPAGSAGSTAWTVARTDAGTVATPFGWRVAVGALDPPSFDVSRANTELGVRVFVVKADDAVELYDAVRQKIGSTVGHPELHLNSQREGWLYDEAVYGSQRVFAACVMAHAGRRDLAVVAIVRGGRDMQVSRAAYEGVGGRDFLCRIMESVHLRSVP